MGYISGLKDNTKLALAEYCRRQRITQVAWVDKHLDADLLAEAQTEPRQKKEAVK